MTQVQLKKERKRERERERDDNEKLKDGERLAVRYLREKKQQEQRH